MRRTMRYLAVLGAFALVVAACGEAEPEPPVDTPDVTGPADELLGEGRVVGMAFDIGGRGDLSFNDLAALAWDEGKADYGYTGDELAPDEGGEGREENLRLLAETGHELIIANGFAFAQNVWRVGTEFPETLFAITDDCPQNADFETVEMDNVACMLFAEEEGSFLMGAAAALKSETGVIGFIGGVEVTLIGKFEAGYIAGARHINPDIEILDSIYLTQPPDFTGFNDPVRGREAALALYGQGADVVYHAAGGSGLGLFQAAQEVSESTGTHVWAIGVDADQHRTVGDPDLAQYILTSMLKRVDVAVADQIERFLTGTFQPGEHRYRLADDGVGYSTTGGFVDDIASELEALRDEIIDGTIEVPDTP